MAIAFDAASSGQSESGSSLTFSHTCTGSNLLLLVGVASNSTNGTDVSGVTYNGVAMTLIGTKASADNETYLFRLVAPAAGANNVVVSFTEDRIIRAGAVSVTGVNQATPIGATGNASGSGTDITVDVTTDTANSWILDAIASGAGAAHTLTVGAGQTSRWDLNGGANNRRGAGSTEPTTTTGAYTMNWTSSVSHVWATFAAEVHEAAVTGSKNLLLVGVG